MTPEQALADGLISESDMAGIRQAEDIVTEASRLQAHYRGEVIRFAAVTCSCLVYFDWNVRTPPQAGCAVHGQLLITAADLGGDVIM